MKDTEIFLGCEKNTVIFSVLYFSSAQINNKISAIFCGCGIFVGMLSGGSKGREPGGPVPPPLYEFFFLQKRSLLAKL